MITCFPLDATLSEPAQPRQPQPKGARRNRGQRLPTLAQVLADAKTTWTRVTLANRCGERRNTIEITSSSAVWYDVGYRPCRFVGSWFVIRKALSNRKSVGHGLECHTRTKHEVACPTPADRSNLSRSAGGFGCRDAATMVGLGDCAHHACLVGTLLAGDLVGTSGRSSRKIAGAASGVVSQTASDLL
jgi:hypothetical protein